MFVPKDSSNHRLLRGCGLRVSTSSDWSRHYTPEMALAIVRQLDDFWRHAGEQDLTLFEGAGATCQARPSRPLLGLASRADEARFPLQPDSAATPYFSEISLTHAEMLEMQNFGFAQAEGIGLTYETRAV